MSLTWTDSDNAAFKKWGKEYEERMEKSFAGGTRSAGEPGDRSILAHGTPPSGRPRSEDPLAPARGILSVALICSVAWGICGLVVWWLVK